VEIVAVMTYVCLGSNITVEDVVVNLVVVMNILKIPQRYNVYLLFLYVAF